MSDKQLKIDTEMIRSMNASLTAALSSIEGEKDRVRRVADLVGHKDLASNIREFSKSWSIARSAVISDLKNITSTTVNVEESFRDLEKTLTRGLKGEGSGTGGPGGSGGGGGGW